jgi:signal transduction histidine kinase
LAYTALQSTEVRLSLAAKEELRKELSDHTNDAATEIGIDLNTISRRLQAAASNPSLLEGIADEEMLTPLLDATHIGMEEYTQGIYYLDADGILLYTTEVESRGEIGSDKSDSAYYVQASERNQPLLVGPFQGTDNKASFSVAVPIYSSRGDLNGILAAIIDAESVANKIGERLPLTDGNQVFILDPDGTILWYQNETSVGEHIVAILGMRDDTSTRNLSLIIQGRSGIFEYEASDTQERIAAYSPVTLSGVHTWSLLVTTPVSQSETFSSVISDQRLFTIVAMALIIIIAAIFLAFILFINKRLHSTVQRQNLQIRDQLNDLQGAYERLTEQDKMKDEFIDIAAHELRTPVLPIILSAEGLAEELGTDNTKIEIILRNAKRISRLTNDILDVSRIKSNTFKLQKEKINAKNLIEEAIQDIVFKMAENKNADLKIVFESKLPPQREEVVIDRARINQVLANLLDNAVNFTTRGTIAVTLQQNEENPDHVEIRVSDTGKGIDPSIRPRLFEKFVTKSVKGTGLGLYLCKAIVEAHGGRIWAEDNTVRGAVFIFTLPKG